MKRLFLFIVILMAGIILFDGCKKSSSSPSIYTMRATIDTSGFNGSNCIAQHSSSSFSPYSLSVYGGSFSGNTPTVPYINFNIGSYTGVGIYLIDNISNTASIDSGATPIVALSGSVVIYSISQYISGSFSFTTLDSTKVTHGTFTAKAP